MSAVFFGLLVVQVAAVALLVPLLLILLSKRQRRSLRRLAALPTGWLVEAIAPQPLLASAPVASSGAPPGGVAEIALGTLPRRCLAVAVVPADTLIARRQRSLSTDAIHR
jgi:hypothetical protein